MPCLWQKGKIVAAPKKMIAKAQNGDLPGVFGDFLGDPFTMLRAEQIGCSATAMMPVLHGVGRGGCHHPPHREPQSLSMSRGAVEGDEVRTDVDMDVVHIRIGHGTPVAVIVNQPGNDLLLLAGSAEVDGLTGGVLGRAARGCDASAGPAGGDDLDVTEFILDGIQQGPGLRRQA
jgi:hypothetical protein